MIQDIFPTRTTIAITLTTPGEFTMTLTTVTFINQHLLSRWGRSLQKGATLHLQRAQTRLQALRGKISRSAKSLTLPTPATGISPIVGYGQKVSTLRTIRELSSKKLRERDSVRSGLRKATYIRHYGMGSKSKLTIRESGPDFWRQIKATAHSESMWERKMVSIFQEIFNLQMQERELVEALEKLEPLVKEQGAQTADWRIPASASKSGLAQQS